jgi:hypothetical protein
VQLATVRIREQVPVRGLHVVRGIQSVNGGPHGGGPHPPGVPGH